MPPVAHRLYDPDLSAAAPAQRTLSGPEAHHAARVKRLRVGEPVEVLNGRGLRAAGTVLDINLVRRHDPTITISIEAVSAHAPVSPALAICSPAPKGDALETMIDQLSQVGAASWQLLRSDRSEREPRSIDRLERAAIESAKQCGRAHFLRIEPPIDLPQILHAPPSNIFIADASGSPCPAILGHATLLIGPEGGWSEAERAAFIAAGIPRIRFGPHIMRIETAAVAAAAAILSTSRTQES